MAFIPATWIVEVVLMWLLDGQEVRNVFHVDPHESPNTSLLEAVAALVVAWVGDTLMDGLSQDLTLYGVQAKDLSSETGGVVFAYPNPPLVGGSAGLSEAGNVAVCVSLQTLLAGRSYRGRFYIPGIPESVVDVARVGTAWATDEVDDFLALIGELQAEGWDLVITSYQNGGVPRESAVSTIVTDVAVNLVSDSQRRRLPGRGL